MSFHTHIRHILRHSLRHSLRMLRYACEMVLAFVFIGLFRLLGVQAGGAFASKLARSIGPLTPTHKMAMQNVARAFPEKSNDEVANIMQGVWDNMGRVVSEHANLDIIRRNHKQYIQIDHAERALQAVKQGRGLIIYSAHMANWEIMSMSIVLIGLQAIGIYRHANNPFFNAWLKKKRKRTVIAEQIPKGVEGARMLVKKLKQKSVICILMDQKMNDGVSVKFFGRTAMTASAPASMARRYNVPLLMVSAERLSNSQFKITFHEPMEAIKTDNQAQDILTMTQQLNDNIEAVIRKNPQQWFWLHKRWPEN